MTHPHVAFAMTIGGAYSEEELEYLRKCVAGRHNYSHIVEIGVHYGRSASIYMQAIEQKHLRVTLIDDWSVGSDEVFQGFTGLRTCFPPVRLLSLKSKIAAPFVDDMNLLHIDGGHEEIETDCRLYLPKLINGGMALFHDYANASFPMIKESVDKWTDGWEDFGVVDSLAIRRKP